jgi:hypothetical protein
MAGRRVVKLVAGLRGRAAVSDEIERFRAPLLNEIAERKKLLIDQQDC